MIKHNTQILTRGIQCILDKYNTAEGCIPCKGDYIRNKVHSNQQWIMEER